MEATMKALPVGPIRRVGAFIVLTSLALWLSPLASTRQSAPANHRLALVGGTIYPAPVQPPISNGVVLIENGKIIEVGEKRRLQIPADVQTIDCAGRTMVAVSRRCVPSHLFQQNPVPVLFGMGFAAAAWDEVERDWI